LRSGSGSDRIRRVGLTAVLAVGLVGAACAIPRWPAEGPVISPFGLRFDGLRPDVHRGIDIRVPTGTEVRAMSPARVRFAGTQSGFGLVVWLDHGGDLLTVYAHLSEIRVRAGESVEHRQVIGLSGATGNATAPHLHFEIWRGGTQRDPVPLLGGPPGRGAISPPS
jgi:murein DD-endopeptidase MepM/ murein hydrolase activator NlpD